MKLFIKNMVCPRCIMAVENVLKKLDIHFLDIKLGEVITQKDLNKKQLTQLDNELNKLGFELLDDSQQQIIEKIKATIIEYIHHKKEYNSNFSQLLSSVLNKDYSYLSKLFSATEGITIEHFIILQKIERVKELLTYNEMTLSEIAIDMEYSSVAHLSSQFKKVTGLTPSQFKSQGINLRQTLDNLK